MPHGFPYRPLRSEYGPPPVDRFPARSAKHDLPSDVGALIFHQVSGLGLVAMLATLRVVMSSSGAVISWRREAWNTEMATAGDYAPPTVTRASEGVLDLAYAATIPDHTGEGQPFLIRGGSGEVLDDDSNVYKVRVIPTEPAGPTCRVRAWRFSGGAWVPHDGALLLRLE